MSLIGRIFGSGHNAHYRRGIVLFNEGRYGLAAAAFEEALAGLGAHDPDWSLGRFYAAEARSKLGLSFLHDGDFEKAREEFSRALERNPDYPDLHYHLAVIEEHRGDLEAASASLERALALNPDYAVALAARALVRSRLGSAAEAERDLERARALGLEVHASVEEEGFVEAVRAALRHKSESEGHLARAVECYERGDRQAALAALEKAVEQEPDFPDLRCRLGTLLLEMGRVEEGAAALEEAVRLNPRYVEALLHLGLAKMAGGRIDEAANAFHLAAEAEPDDPEIPLYEADALFHAGRVESARSIAATAAQAAPRLWHAHYLCGLCDLALGHPGAAAEAFGNAAALRPGGSPGRLEIASAALALGEAETAEAQYRRLARSFPEDAGAWFGLGIALQRTGRAEEARAVFAKLLENEPTCFAARRELGRVLLETGHPREAARELGEAEQLCADDPSTLHLLGTALRYLGCEEEAARRFRQAVSLDRGAVAARIDLALSCLRMGRTEEANVLLDEALLRDPLNAAVRALRRGPLGEAASSRAEPIVENAAV